MRCVTMVERSDREIGFRRKATGSILVAIGAIGLVTAGAVWQLPAEGEPAMETTASAAADHPSVDGTAPLKASAPFLAGLGLTAIAAGGTLWYVGDRATSETRGSNGDKQGRSGLGGWSRSS